ncbi:hypothetical protein Bca101_043920 [Brassica carinata]
MASSSDLKSGSCSFTVEVKDPKLSHHHAVAHEGIGFPCWVLPDLMSFTERFRQDAYDKFSGDLYEFCCKDADDDCKTVIVAVVDGDYLRRSFGDVHDIVPIADSVTKLIASIISIIKLSSELQTKFWILTRQELTPVWRQLLL